ncbi:MAG: hypothetical protein LBH05_02625 [Deferribacteraceae bacterium]|jgi:hypothetical protein|nr:hypothetical protein [Deferribacteraceae bacterium]
MAIGFDEKTADNRMAQYEPGTRTTKENYIADMANALVNAFKDRLKAYLKKVQL